MLSLRVVFPSFLPSIPSQRTPRHSCVGVHVLSVRMLVDSRVCVLRVHCWWARARI